MVLPLLTVSQPFYLVLLAAEFYLSRHADVPRGTFHAIASKQHGFPRRDGITIALPENISVTSGRLSRCVEMPCGAPLRK
jgi:hypothetical protein